MSQVGPVVGAVESVLQTGWGKGLLAIAVVGGSYLAGRLINRLVGRRIARRFQRPSITRTMLRSIRVMAVIIGVLLALGIVGLRITELALSVTVFSAVLGLVLAPIVGSVINGLFILADQPYEIGDMVEFVDSSQTGFVEDITLRYTKVFTLNNTFLVVPNSEMRERDIVNYSAEDERTRLALDVLVTYEGDLEKARSLIEEGAATVDNVIASGPEIRIGSARYPAGPTCYIDAYGDHGVKLRLRYWAKRPYKLLATRSNVQTEVWTRLQETEDVSIAYPHSHLMFDETSGTAHVEMDENPGQASDRPGSPTGTQPSADTENDRD